MEKTKTELGCKLTDEELREQKERIRADLKDDLQDKQEIADGFVYAFGGSDATIDKLLNFIRIERQCCPFFRFELTIRDEKTDILLKITGPDGVKEFLLNELKLR